MHYSTKRRVVLGMTTGGLLMTGIGMANAQADTTASGGTAHSPGIGSGNAVELPINAPINVCGNQVDVIGILNSVTGNSCTNKGGGGSTSATGSAKGSPGVGSGNLIEVPINAPINVCGNQLDVIGIGDSVSGNSCENKGGGSTTATGSAKGSPGVGSGNLIQVPINTPVNVCGNQVDVIGILNSVTGNSCENGGSGGKPPHPHPTPTPPGTPTPTPTTPVTPPPTSTPTTPPTGCSCPPPPPPTTPCPPSGTTTPTSSPTSTGTPTSTASTPGTPSSTPSTPGSPSSTPSSTATTKPPTGTPSATSTSTGWHGGGGTGGHHGTGSETGSNGSSSGGKSTGILAHTGSGAMTVAPLGAGLIGGGVFLRRRFPSRSH